VRQDVFSLSLAPGESMPSDGGEIVVLLRSPEYRAGMLRGCNNLCWIARPARCDLDLEIDTRDALYHLNYVTDREDHHNSRNLMSARSQQRRR
jgi:hypothetical protein